jgi:hypothetical protein
MSNIANFLQRLMRNVYFTIYHTDHTDTTKKRVKSAIKEQDIEFCLQTAPSLQIESVDDLVKLASLDGALTVTELKRVVQLMLYGHVLPSAASQKQNSSNSTSNTNSSAPVLLADASAAAGKKRKVETPANAK